MMSNRVLTAGVSCLIGALAGVRVGGAAVIADSFTLTPDRAAFSALDGQLTETGNATWSATSDIQLQPGGNGALDGAIGSMTGGDPFAGNGFGFVPLAFTTGVADVQAQLHPASAADPSNWIAIGFGTGANFAASGNPWALLRADGRVQLFGGPAISANNVEASPGAGAYSFDPDNFNAVDLTFDSSNNLATLSVNGTVAATLTVLNPGAIQSAGFAFYHQNAADSVTPAILDDFAASAPIPEPSTAGLLAAGAAGLIARRRKNFSAH